MRSPPAEQWIGGMEMLPFEASATCSQEPSSVVVTGSGEHSQPKIAVIIP